MSAKRMQIREEIQITGASENNLKRVNVNIPKERLVVVAGVSVQAKARSPLTPWRPESSPGMAGDVPAVSQEPAAAL